MNRDTVFEKMPLRKLKRMCNMLISISILSILFDFLIFHTI
jgi:hypothetical protein